MLTIWRPNITGIYISEQRRYQKSYFICAYVKEEENHMYVSAYSVMDIKLSCFVIKFEK